MTEEIYVWGTGCGAGELIERGIDPARVRGFVDSFPSGESFMGLELISPEELARRDYALVIVTSRRANEIESRAAELGLDLSRLLFLKNNFRLTDRNSCYAEAERLLGSDTVKKLRAPCSIAGEPFWAADSKLDSRDAENDWVRVRTLEAACRELSRTPGAAAELGVYKGGFARCINALLPERRLYLFDSFEGFDEAEAGREQALGRIAEGFIQAHKNTSLELVMGLMPHPEQVRPMPGLFPDSLGGLEESFALVSIDVDLEDSIYAGLSYFVPRLVPGGYIFLHDYNSPTLAGVKAALRRYERERGEMLRAIPLCDLGGSLVICG